MNVVPPCLPNVEGFLQKLDKVAIQFGFVTWEESAFPHLKLMQYSSVEDAAHLDFVRLANLVLVLVSVQPLSLAHAYEVW